MKSIYNQPTESRGTLPLTRLLLSAPPMRPGYHYFRPVHPVAVAGEAVLPAILCFAVTGAALCAQLDHEQAAYDWLWIGPATFALLQAWMVVGGLLEALTRRRVRSNVVFSLGMAVAAWLAWQANGWPRNIVLLALVFLGVNLLAYGILKFRKPEHPQQS